MTSIPSSDFVTLYAGFQSPISSLDCGERCAPYNERGVPFCCDTRHAVPTAYRPEWEYLCNNTDLWHEWAGQTEKETTELQAQTPAGQVLIECLGHRLCQRDYRTVTCRAFPFFPYLTRQGEFVGLSYYWTYEDRCWVMSNLALVSREYVTEFVTTYERIFARMPEEEENFRYHSMMMRRIFGRRHRSIPLLHRDGGFYKITPRNGRMRRVKLEGLPKFGPYKIAATLRFADDP